MRTIEWDDQTQQMVMIDQRLLPGAIKKIAYPEHTSIVRAIKDMVVRGAPAIGAAAAFGVALAAKNSSTSNIEKLKNEIADAASLLAGSRPTAVNLTWALNRMLAVSDAYSGSPDGLYAALLDEALAIADQDVKINERIAAYGADLIQPGETIIHHCNTGALATVDWGTALGVIRKAHELGKGIHVLVDETRPRLQGSRLTAWELEQYGVPYDIISDNAAGFFLSRGEVQRAFVGADRVAANGDVANKIGTYMLALAARDNRVPFYVAVPTSTIDLDMPDGESIPIEERGQEEVLGIELNGERVSPESASARNPAFDITPHVLVTAFITEYGIVEPPYSENLARIKQQAQKR